MAIALDATTDGGSAVGTTLTFAHTCTGSELLLWVMVQTTSDSVTGVTYNGVGMTQATKNTSGTGTGVIYIYYLAGPSTGSNNVEITTSLSVTILGIAASYTGCSQTGIPDASATISTTGVGSGTWFGPDFSTVANNCWFGFYAVKTFTEVPAATFQVVDRRTGAGYGYFDSNGAKTPAGTAQPRCAHTGGSQNYAGIGFSFAPPGANPIINNLSLLGAGA